MTTLPAMPDRLAAASDILTIADKGLDLALRGLGAFGMLSPASRAARLRARALRLRARADALDGRPFDWPRRDRLRARARGLELRADALAPLPPPELPPPSPRG